MTFFTPKMIEIVKNFTQITNSGIVFPSGKTVSVQDGGGIGVDRDSGRSVIAVAQLEAPIEEDFAVYNPMQFLTALQMFEGPCVNIDQDTKKISVHEQGKKTGKFLFNLASPAVVKAPGTVNFPKDPANKTFRMSADTYQRIFKGVAIVNSPEIMIYGQNGELLIAAHDTKDKQSDTFILPVGETDQEFNVVVKVDSINKLLKNVNYDVTIAPAGILQAQSASEEFDICYYIAGTYQTS